MKTIDKALILAVVLLLIYWIGLLFQPGFYGPLTLFYDWLSEVAVYLGYSGLLAASFLGSASVIAEVPFAGIPFLFGGLKSVPGGSFVFDPWIVGLVSGIGAATGDMVSYLLGYWGRAILKEWDGSAFRTFIESHPRATPFVIWVLAATPLPLDPALVSLGTVRYSWWKVLIPTLIGEIIFLIGVAWSGRLSLDWTLNILGIGGPHTLFSISMQVLEILLLVLTIYFIVKIDWKRFMEKHITI